MDQNSKPKRGVIFIVVGEKFLYDAECAARSLREHNPELPICLFSDVPSSSTVFDMKNAITNPHRRSKLDCLLLTPFEQTLYLDSDIKVVADVSEPFDLLERYDIAGCHVENRNPVTSVTGRLKSPSVPHAFTGFNGGVIYYAMNPNMRLFLERWAEAFKAENVGDAGSQAHRPSARI
jgi:hypothetical protein